MHRRAGYPGMAVRPDESIFPKREVFPTICYVPEAAQPRIYINSGGPVRQLITPTQATFLKTFLGRDRRLFRIIIRCVSHPILTDGSRWRTGAAGARGCLRLATAAPRQAIPMATARCPRFAHARARIRHASNGAPASTRLADARVWFQAVPCVASSESRSAAHALHTIPTTTIHSPSGTLTVSTRGHRATGRARPRRRRAALGQPRDAGPPALALAPK